MRAMRGWVVALLALLAILVTACAAAPPVYYKSGGTHWTIPIVNPVDNDQVIVPVMLQGKGPYLFIVDPYALPAIDRGLAEELGLYLQTNSAGDPWLEFFNQRDERVERAFYEVLSMSVGNLELYKTRLLGVPKGSLRVGDTPIQGILGGWLLTSTIILDVDRDAGLLHLVLTGTGSRPSRAEGVRGRVYHEELFVMAKVGKERRELEFRVDVGSRWSAIWPRLAQELEFVFGHPEERIDSLGCAATVPSPGGLLKFHIGDAISTVLAFGAWLDKRDRQVDFDGVLGQDFLSRFRTVLDRDQKVVWLAPRDRNLATHRSERIARWGGAFAGCAAAGCATVTVEAAAQGGLPRLVVTRDPTLGAQRYAVVLEPIDPNGKPIAAHLLRVTLEPGTPAVSPVEPSLAAPLAAGATYRVVDVSPFPTPCASGECFAVVPRRVL